MKTPVVFACALLLCTPVVAQLVSVDYQTSGDGLLTFDPNAGLSWLDITRTYGRDQDQIAAALALGEEFPGFRFATVEEFTSLHTSFGLPVAHDGDAIGMTPSLVARSLQLQTLVGYATPSLLPQYTAYISAGYLLTTPEPGTHARNFGLIQVIDYVAPASTDFYRAEWYPVEQVASPYLGSWLVREFTPVPEPGAYAIGAVVGLGIAIVGRRARTRMKAARSTPGNPRPDQKKAPRNDRGA